jgi:sugar lactone lactonase YvrE
MVQRRARALGATVLGFATMALLAIPAAAASAAATGGAATLGGAATGVRPGNAFPTEFPLPVGFLPEGIAIGDRPLAYFGSRANGDIFRVDLATGAGQVVSQGPGPGFPSVGIKIDQRGRLFVSGGGAGNARVVNVHTGAILASYQFVVPVPGANNTFINDVVLTPAGAYYTDSRSAVLFHLPLGRHGRLPTQDAVVRIPLSGDWAPNADGVAPSSNGLSRTPDGRALIMVASNFGTLFRVDPSTGVATTIDLGGETVVNGDGLLLNGRTLYVVQNRLNTVAVIRLNRQGTAGTVQQRVTDPRFDVPTTVAMFRDRLYLPNARFGIASPETATYNAVAIPKP